jgi:hypothetical protein
VFTISFRSFQLGARWLRCGFMAAAIAALAACGTVNSRYTGDAKALAELAREPLPTEPWNFGGHPGVVITTPHYRIYSTIDDPLYQRLLAKTLEAAYARGSLANPQVRVAGPLECYVFASRHQWETYTRLRAGSNAPIYLQISAGGYCQEGVFAGYDIGSREQTLSVVSHEAWHQYSWFAFKDRLPSWLEEGLATQNEAIEWQGTAPHFKPEQNWRRYMAVKDAIRERRLWKIADLTSTHAGRVIKMQQKHVDAYYAQLWSLVLFLKNSPKYQQGLQRMLSDANEGKLTATLTGTGVTRREIDNFTEKWNTVAGPVYLKKYIAADVNLLQHEYETWCGEFTQTWPPKIPQSK